MTLTESTPTLVIGDRRIPATDGATLPVVNPADETEFSAIPAGGAADIAEAVEAATAAAPAWAGLSWQRRAELLVELSARIAESAEELARLDSRDGGNPISGMRWDANRAVEELRYFAGLGGELKGDNVPWTAAQYGQTVREPYGVVGRITAYNHPFLFAVNKTAAPLIAGNSVVLKPSEHTSLSTIRFAELAADVLPSGVLNVVTGTGASAGAALVEHPDVPRIAFTGGVPTGRSILRSAAEHIKHVTAELGGKNPMIVFPDVDVAAAASAAVDGMNFRRSTGQSCQSNSRVLVHSSIADELIDRIGEQVAGLRIGDPLNDDVEVGPLAFRAHYDRVLSYIEAGHRDGAELVTGGKRPAGIEKGYFVEPTVFRGVLPGMTIAQEEIFGPVLSILTWDDYETMIGVANDVEYGLTANIWTNDHSTAQRTARLIQAGLVWINGNGTRPVGVPFGGFKYSGLGKEGSLAEVLGYTREKAIVINVGSARA